MDEVGELVENRLARTILSLAVVLGATLAARWTIRTAATRRYEARRTEEPAEMPYVPAARVWSLKEILPAELHVNVAGVAVPRTRERLHMPYSLAVDVADDRAAAAGWERIDPPGGLTVANLSGSSRLYRKPDGAVVLRSLRPVQGDDTMAEDLEFPAVMAQSPEAPVLPDEMSRRMAGQVRELLPDMLKDLVVGNPLLFDLVERGDGAALLVLTATETTDVATAVAIADGARRSGWTDARPAAARSSPDLFPPRYTKQNLTLDFKITPRPDGAGCNVSYRFTDDEVLVPNQRSNQ